MRTFILSLALLAVLLIACQGLARNRSGPPMQMRRPAPPVSEALEPGLVVNDAEASPGYTLFSPMGSFRTYLMDMDGSPVKTWNSSLRTASSVYLLENGNLLRTVMQGDRPGPSDQGPGGMSIQETSPDGVVVWEYRLPDSSRSLHHDIAPLPNGNVLVLAKEYKDRDDILAAGGDPAVHPEGEIWSDAVLEIGRTGPDSGRIVWEWHAWDHLVQDHDSGAPGFASPLSSSGRIHLNYNPMGNSDWHHANSVDYSESLDLILVSVHSFSEIWVIDHSTTTAQAASGQGGRYDRGGDLLYRWGNPQAYEGTGSQQLFLQHDARWIEREGELRILVFNNGTHRMNRSDVLLIQPESFGSTTGTNARILWSYNDAGGDSFFADRISGAQLLENGDVLICAGTSSRIFEATPDGDIVWDYRHAAQEGASGEGLPRNDRPSHIFKALRLPADHPGVVAALGG